MKKELTLFDNPKNVKILLITFYCSLVVLLISEFFIHPHPAFSFEHVKGFSAVYGFFSCVLLILKRENQVHLHAANPCGSLLCPGKYSLWKYLDL